MTDAIRKAERILEESVDESAKIVAQALIDAHKEEKRDTVRTKLRVQQLKVKVLREELKELIVAIDNAKDSLPAPAREKIEAAIAKARNL